MMFQVPSCSNCNVQFAGSHLKIPPPCSMVEVGVQKGPHDCNSLSFPTRSCILLHCEVWWSRMDDLSRFFLGANKWLPHCLCPNNCTKRLQGWLPYTMIFSASNAISLFFLHMTICWWLWFCRGLRQMRWAIYLCYGYWVAYFQGLPSIGFGS